MEPDRHSEPLLRALVWTGHIDNAVRRAESRGEVEARFEGLTAIVHALGERGMHAGDADLVRALLPRIDAAIAACSKGRTPGRVLTLVVALLQGALLDDALARLATLSPGGQRSSGEGSLAIARAEAGDVRGALELARGAPLSWFGPDRIPGAHARLPASRAEVLAGIASARFAANDEAEAIAVAEEADAARSGIEDWKQEVAGAAIVRALARGGRFDRAEEVARSLPTSSAVLEASLVLVDAVAVRGELDRARAIVGATERRLDARDALILGAPPGSLADTRDVIAGFMVDSLRAALVAALCRAGAYEQARAILPTIAKSTRAWVVAAAALARALAASGARGEAVSLFDEIAATLGAAPAPDWGALAVTALAASGFAARVIPLLDAQPPLARDRTLADAAIAAIEAGHPDVARTLVTALPVAPSFARAEALRRIGRAFAEAGDLGEAEALADAIPSSAATPIGQQRIALLSSIAVAAARAGDVSCAARAVEGASA